MKHLKLFENIKNWQRMYPHKADFVEYFSIADDMGSSAVSYLTKYLKTNYPYFDNKYIGKTFYIGDYNDQLNVPFFTSGSRDQRESYTITHILIWKNLDDYYNFYVYTHQSMNISIFYTASTIEDALLLIKYLLG